MARVSKEIRKPKHEHTWINNRCECGAERMSPAEFVERKRVWDEYYEKVRETESFQIYQLAREALKDKKFDLVKEIAKRAREIKEEGNWLPKPFHPDPLMEQAYGRLVINW